MLQDVKCGVCILGCVCEGEVSYEVDGAGTLIFQSSNQTTSPFFWGCEEAGQLQSPSQSLMHLRPICFTDTLPLCAEGCPVLFA